MRTKRITSQKITNGARRIDGKFFLNEDSLYSAVLEDNANRCVPLSQVADVFNPSIFKRQFCQNTERAVMYFQSSDVPTLSEYSSVFINKKQAESLRTLVSENQTLVTGFGTIGNVRLVSKLQEGACYANNVCRITTKSPNLYGFVYAFMASKYAKAQLNKNASGSVVRFIEAPGIRRTLVPILPESKQQEIHNLIVESANLRVEADRLLNNAENELLKGINTKTNDRLFDPSERTIGNIFQINKGQLSTLTFRARNYSQRKQLIINKLSSVSYNKLIQVLEYPPHYGLRFKRIEAKRGYTELLSQGDIFNYKPTGRKISTRNISFIEKEIVKKGTILIPGQGTLGENEIFARAKFIWGYLENKLVAGHAMRFVPNKEKIGEGYLFAVLSSKCWFRLLRNSVYGTNLLGFIVPMINDYPIPRFNQDFENQIDSQVKKAYEMYTKSISKENQAISLVEKEIESWQQS